MSGKPKYLYEIVQVQVDLTSENNFLLQVETTGDIDISLHLDRKTLEAFRDRIALALSERK